MSWGWSTSYIPHKLTSWKKQLKDGAAGIFEHPSKKAEDENHETELYEEIGRLKMQLEWLKKKAALFDE